MAFLYGWAFPRFDDFRDSGLVFPDDELLPTFRKGFPFSEGSTGSCGVRPEVSAEQECRLSTSDRFDPIVGNSTLIQDLWSFVLEVSDSRLPVLLTGEDGVGKKLVARKIHATGCVAGSSLRFLRGSSLRMDQIEEDGLAHSFLSRAGTVYVGEAESIPTPVWLELIRSITRDGNRLPRLIFGFRSEPSEAVAKFVSQMTWSGSFTLTPLSQRREDISPIARYQIWSHSLKEDFQERWAQFESELLPDFMTRDWNGNVEELLQEVKEFCEISADADGSRLVGEINTSVSAHWLKEQFERMHEKLLDRWDHEDSLAAGELPGETWGIR